MGEFNYLVLDDESETSLPVLGPYKFENGSIYHG
jgi:hypothetical protein